MGVLLTGAQEAHAFGDEAAAARHAADVVQHRHVPAQYKFESKVSTQFSHILASSVGTRHGQEAVKLGSSWSHKRGSS
jgi:hypothetical protein